MDAESEMIIQRLIREEFSGRTIIAIAHKLDTVLDFDCVVILDKGHVAEMGNPRELLALPDSLFRRQYDSL
jgi:ABC-type multidrug transport system fused ATPase/permease subunit